MRLFYMNGATLRRESPLNINKIYRARDRSGKFRFGVSAFLKIRRRAQCRFAPGVNSRQASEYVEQAIAVRESRQIFLHRIELEHGDRCGKVLPRALVHLHIGESPRRLERARVRQCAHNLGVR